MKQVGLIYQTGLKLQDIQLGAFAFSKFLPRLKQILDRNDIVVGMQENTSLTTPPRRDFLPVLERLKQAYILWHEYYSTLPKVHRYTVGERIDTLFIEVMEAVSGAAYLPKDKKLPYISLSIRKLNTVALLLMILWETKSLRDKKYIALSIQLDAAGKMLGGWQGQLQKQISPARAEEK